MKLFYIQYTNGGQLQTKYTMYTMEFLCFTNDFQGIEVCIFLLHQHKSETLENKGLILSLIHVSNLVSTLHSLWVKRVGTTQMVSHCQTNE